MLTKQKNKQIKTVYTMQENIDEYYHGNRLLAQQRILKELNETILEIIQSDHHQKSSPTQQTQMVKAARQTILQNISGFDPDKETAESYFRPLICSALDDMEKQKDDQKDKDQKMDKMDDTGIYSAKRTSDNKTVTGFLICDPDNPYTYILTKDDLKKMVVDKKNGEAYCMLTSVRKDTVRKI